MQVFRCVDIQIEYLELGPVELDKNWLDSIQYVQYQVASLSLG
jgi:hypothetical protein